MSSFAAIFDWDGVIVESSAQHERAWRRLAAELGRSVPDGVFRRSFGMKNERVIRDLLGWTADPGLLDEWSRRKEEWFRQIVSDEGLATVPGTREWLERMRSAGIPCAIGSSTPRLNIELATARLGLEGRFDALVSAEDVSHGKPHPEVFLVAAARLGVDPRRCVVFEDAHVGIEAARSAGMRVVAVTTTHAAEALVGADWVVDRLDRLDLPTLEGWFRA